MLSLSHLSPTLADRIRSHMKYADDDALDHIDEVEFNFDQLADDADEWWTIDDVDDE
jgi:hypothetical protein